MVPHNGPPLNSLLTIIATIIGFSSPSEAADKNFQLNNEYARTAAENVGYAKVSVFEKVVKSNPLNIGIMLSYYTDLAFSSSDNFCDILIIFGEPVF